MINKYEIKNEIDHILDRSGMWIGSKNIELVESWLFKPSTGRFTLVDNATYLAGLHKIIDEVISNSIDEFRRSKHNQSLFQITKINVTVNAHDGLIVVEDDGGIPVEKHKVGLYIPEVIFGVLRSSSNYDDSQNRDWIGTNGLGCKLTNIYSKKYVVETADGKNAFRVEWTNNMKDKTEPIINPSTDHYTRTTFLIDLERFDLMNLDLSACRFIHKRLIDAAATNPGLEVNFKCDIGAGKLDGTFKFNSFVDYVKLYIDTFTETKISNGSVIISPTKIDNIGFVNGALCSRGTHIDHLQKQIAQRVLQYLHDEGLSLITEKDVINHFSVFCNLTIFNPTYDSQTKERLTNKLLLKLPQTFFDEILTEESLLIQNLHEFYKQKYAKEAAKELKKLNNLIKTTKTKKLIKSNSTQSKDLELWLFEGDSAGNGFRTKRDPRYQSGYLLRGKIKNTMNLNRTEVLDNVELREVIAACNLQFDASSKNLKTCPFEKIIIATDSDYDGSHIAGLLLAFFGTHFPELIKDGRVYRSISPLIICTPDKQTQEKKYYYSFDEFDYDVYHKNINPKQYEIAYAKGLGRLDDKDYSQMLHNKNLIKFHIKDTKDIDMLNVWFGKKTDQRKTIILEDMMGYENIE
jgi:DNA topoisomerase-2